MTREELESLLKQELFFLFFLAFNKFKKSDMNKIKYIKKERVSERKRGPHQAA